MHHQHQYRLRNGTARVRNIAHTYYLNVEISNPSPGTSGKGGLELEVMKDASCPIPSAEARNVAAPSSLMEVEVRLALVLGSYWAHGS
jgi:hypothetical protein